METKYADVHCHLDNERYEDLDSVVKRARDSGVKLIITSGVNPSSNRKVLEISKKYSDVVKCSFGIYPVDAVANKVELEEEFLRFVEKFDIDSELSWIEENKDSCVAIGEIGLDYKIVKGAEELQKENFRKCIVLAKKIDKPIVIHSRNAESDALDVMEEMGAEKVVLHCFSGKKSLIKRAVELGYYFSVPAVISRLEHFKMLVEIVPLDLLLTETDGPYLARVVGALSEPSDVVNTIKEIAKIKCLNEVGVRDKIWENVEKVFGKV